MIKFDFVINQQMYEKLEDLAKNEAKKVCDIVYKIIIFMLPVLQMKHLTDQRRNNEYPIVDGKIRIRVSIPEIVYNQLKMIHDHLNTFSIAVLVRELLNEYLEKTEETSEEEYKKEVEKKEREIMFMKDKKCCCVKLGVVGNDEDIPPEIDSKLSYLVGLDENFCLKEFQFL